MIAPSYNPHKNFFAMKARRPARLLRQLILLFLAAFVGTLTPALAKNMQAPGSRVSMDLPENFKPSPMFSGFMEIISSAAIIVLELPPEAYDRVSAGFTQEALGAKGITDVKISQLKRSDTHVYFSAEQIHPRATFEKHILLIKDAKNTAVLTFNVPKGSLENGSIKRDDVIKALSTAKLEAKAAPSRDLFKLGYLGPFEQTGSLTGTSRMYADTDDPSPPSIRNILAVAPSLNQLPINDIKEFSEYALEKLDNAKDISNKTATDLRIDKMAGHLITASATRGENQTPVVLRQLILLPEAGGYFRLLSVTKATDEQRLRPELDKIFRSFEATTEAQRVE